MPHNMISTLFLLLILSNCAKNLENNVDKSDGQDNVISQVEPEDYPDFLSDDPLTQSRGARIMTGSERTRRSQIFEFRTSLGIVVGTIEQSASIVPAGQGRPFYAFRGIPYAKPPVGPLRWADPQELTEPWERSRWDATRFKNFCPQYDHDKKSVVGNEDCLYLNVFSPLLPDISRRTPRLPVFVFIHGGAYTRGASSSHGPERLMREDIVLVTINYRLGVLGLLSTDNSVIPGNYAALDQIAALKWVRRHIAEFGGDPDTVTLGGFSAGASFVHLHMMSPLSQGLFHRAIIMSGAGNCLWSVQPYPWEVAKELAYDLNCPTYSATALKQCLLLIDTDALIEAQTKRSKYVYWPFDYRPVVDGHSRYNPFLPAPMEELLREPLVSNHIPVLMGGTPEEGILFALTILLHSGESSNPKGVFDNSISYLFESVWPNYTTAYHASESLTSFYFSENAKKDVNTLVAELTDATTDLLITSCMWDAAANLASFQYPVYTYLMTHHDENSPSFGAPLYRLAAAAGVTSPLLSHGVSHGDDVILLFSFPFTLGDMSARDTQMSLVLTSMWGSFIKTGTPQGGASVTSQLPPWIPIQPGNPVFYYRLSLSPRMIEKPYRHKERNLWQQTMPLIEKTYYDSYTGWIGFWVLLALFLLLLLIVIILTVVYVKSKRSKSYPGSGATLRSQIPRPPSLIHS